MVKNPSILSWIQMLIQITIKIQSPVGRLVAKSNLPRTFQANPSEAFSVIVLTKFFALSCNSEKSENPVLDLNANPDHHQNIAD